MGVYAQRLRFASHRATTHNPPPKTHHPAAHPSAPINIFVTSHPIALFLALDRVFMTSPLGSTTVALMMCSPFMVPYRTAPVPDLRKASRQGVISDSATPKRGGEQCVSSAEGDNRQ